MQGLRAELDKRLTAAAAKKCEKSRAASEAAGYSPAPAPPPPASAVRSESKSNFVHYNQMRGFCREGHGLVFLLPGGWHGGRPQAWAGVPGRAVCLKDVGWALRHLIRSGRYYPELDDGDFDFDDFE